MPTPRGIEWQRRPADPASDQRRRKASQTRPIPGTGSFPVNNDGSVKRQHIRRKYEEDERQQVAERRKVGACEACKLSKTKCTHDMSPPNATDKFQEAQSHEMFVLGLTTTSEIDSLNEHTHVMGQVIAAIDDKLEGRDAHNQVIGMQHPVGQPPVSASQRKRRDEANKSEYRPICKKPEHANPPKLSTTVHYEPAPPVGLQPKVITWNSRPKQIHRNRLLLAKPDKPLRHRKDQTCQPYDVAPSYPDEIQHYPPPMDNRGAKASPYHVSQASQRPAPIIVPHMQPSYLGWGHQEPQLYPYQAQAGLVQRSEKSNASENPRFPPQPGSLYESPAVQQQLQEGPAIGKEPSLPLSGCVTEVDSRLNETGVFYYPGLKYGAHTEWDQSTAVTENLDIANLSFEGNTPVTSGSKLAEGEDDLGDLDFRSIFSDEPLGEFPLSSFLVPGYD